MRSAKQAINKMRGVRESFLLKDGTRFSLPRPKGTAQAAVYSYMIECAVCDMDRRPRPQPTEFHFALADAANRLHAIRLFDADFTPVAEGTRHQGGSVCWDCLLREGEIRHMSMAPSSAGEDLRPIPHGSAEPLDWSDVHVLYEEVTA